jgi:hypothetical protein
MTRVSRALSFSFVVLGALFATLVSPAAEASVARDGTAGTAATACAGGPCAMFFLGKGDGSGVIQISDPTGPKEPCPVPPMCARTLDYPNDQGVATMRAVPNQGFVFAGWENCPDNLADGSCSVNIQDFINTEYLCALFLRPGSPRPAEGCPPSAFAPPPPPRDTVAPNTIVIAAPPRSTRSRRAVFRFRASERANFVCKLDARPWLPCRSPKAYARLRIGWHTFRVRAIDRAGNIDPTPASRRWRITA